MQPSLTAIYEHGNWSVSSAWHVLQSDGAVVSTSFSFVVIKNCMGHFGVFWDV